MVYARNLRRLAIVTASLIGVMGFAEAASASTWTQTHSRRAEVNWRLNHQADRIAHAEVHGALSPRGAARLLREDNQVRREERMMAAQDHGHISRLEQRALNQQENRISRQIP